MNVGNFGNPYGVTICIFDDTIYRLDELYNMYLNDILSLILWLMFHYSKIFGNIIIGLPKASMLLPVVLL